MPHPISPCDKNKAAAALGFRPLPLTDRIGHPTPKDAAASPPSRNRLVQYPRQPEETI